MAQAVALAAIDETKDKLGEGTVKEAREVIASLRAAIEKQDDDSIKSDLAKLEKLMGDIAAKAYEGAAAGGGGAPGGDDEPPASGKSGKGGGKKDDVIDAEFEEGN